MHPATAESIFPVSRPIHVSPRLRLPLASARHRQALGILLRIPAISILFILFLGRTRSAAVTLSSECKVVNDTAVALLANERPTEAESRLSQFVLQRGPSANNKLCLAVTFGNLAIALERTGKLDAADQAARRSAKLFEETLGPNAPELCYPLRTLSQVMNQKGHYREAWKLLTRVEALPPAAPSDPAVNHGLRAILLEEKSELADAELEYRKSITAWERLGRGALPEVLPELGNLASFYIQRQRIPEALTLLERALRITETVSCDANVRVGTLAMLAFAHSLHRDDAEAEKYFQRGIDLLDSLPPAARAQTGRKLYFAYSSFLAKVGRKKEAREAIRKANALFGRDPSGMSVDIDSWPLMATQH